MQKTVIIDCFPESVASYRRGYAVVAIDVIRATTTAVTCVALGRRCFPVSSIEAVQRLSLSLENPLLVGELAGKMPEGFEMNNSPAELARRTDLDRSVVLLSSSGSRLICDAAECETSYLACFRNFAVIAQQLLRHSKVALIGAGSRGEFREEDQLCCAWIAAILMDAGYEAENQQTHDMVEHWRGAPVTACAYGHSGAYLIKSGQSRDLDFVLQHVNDLDLVCVMREGEVAIETSSHETGMPWNLLPGTGPTLRA